MSNPLIDVQKYGQSIWYDNIRRGMITSGDLQRMIDDDGLLGITSNPAIFEKAIADSNDYDPAIRAHVLQGVDSAMDIYERVAIEDIQLAADMLRLVFDRTGRRDGYVSFEVSPYLAADTAKTVEYARRVHKLLGRENVLIKVPGTPEGMPAIATLIGEGISVNVTLLFSVDAYVACAEAYMEGLETWVGKGNDPSLLASVASFFISRIDSLVDDKLAEAAAANPGRKAEIEGLLGKVAVANGLVAYDRYHQLIGSDRWQALAAKGASTQRVLWASTSTKNKAYPKTKYVDELVGQDTVNTIPTDTFNEYRESGKPTPALQDGWDAKLAAAKATMATLADVGVSMDACTDQLLEEGVTKFSQAFDTLLKAIEKKRSVLNAA
ncbi:MAG: transaldolase [Candidatus Binatia bacterium]|nr:transaldolase [Candidatus Binatia bacterium]